MATNEQAAATGMTSDYRSQPVQDRASYNKVVQNSMYPDKDQGIIIDGKGYNTSLERYVEALAVLVQPRHIMYASKISNNRVCIFLTSKKLVDDITEKYKTINVDGSEQNLRPYVSKQRRIVLSNVYPVIPNSVIEEELDKLKVIRSSPVTFLRAGFAKENFTHILSFRRQLYVPEESVSKIPDSIVVEFKGERNWIYLSSGNIKCFQCKEEGHIAKNCKNVDIANPCNNETIQQAMDTVNENEVSSKDLQSFPPLGQVKPNKRALSQIANTSTDTASISTSNCSNLNKDNLNKPAKKKKKKVNSEKSEGSNVKKNIDEQLAPVKEKIEESSKLMNFEQLKGFLEDTYNSNNTFQISLNYTRETEKLIEQLRELYPFLEDRGMKSRFTRIMKKLEKPLISETSRPPSDNEDSSSEDFNNED